MNKKLLLLVFSLFTIASLQAQLSISFSNIVPPTCNNGCNAGATALASGGVAPYEYYWSSGEETPNATGLCANSAYVEVYDANGDYTYDYVNIPNPPVTFTVSIIPSTTDAVCPGTPITFTAQGADTYVWYYGYSTANPLVYSPPSPTSIFVTGTNTATGCTAMATLNIPVKPRPTITVTQGPAYVCEGTHTYVSVSGNSDYYTWSDGVTRPDSFSVTQSFYGVVTGYSSTTGCASQAYNPIITVFPAPAIYINSYPACRGEMNYVTAQGGNSYVWNTGSTNMQIGFLADNDTSFSVIGTGGAGCTDTAYVTVHVNPLPAVMATASEDTVCGNTYVNFYASGADTYNWNYGCQDDTITHFVASSEDLHVTGTDTVSGCQNNASIHIEHVYMPDLSPYGQTIYCFGDSLNVAAQNYDGYTWYPGGATGEHPQLYTPVSVTYTVTGIRTGTSCIATDSIAITIVPLPAVTAIADMDSVCPGSTVNLSATGADYFYWNTPTQPQINQTESYIVTGHMYANNCVNSDTITIVARALPVVVATAADSMLCPGEYATLTAYGASSYVWSPGNITAASFTETISQAGYYYVTGTDNSGCSNTSMVTVFMGTDPTLYPTTSLNNVCAGTSITLSVSGADVYTWDGIAQGNTYDVTPDSTQTYMVTGTYLNSGCTDTAYINIVARPLPVISVSASNDTICEYGDVTLYGSGASMYEWLPGNLVWATSYQFQMLSPQTFTVRGQDASGCYSLPVSISIGVETINTGMQLPVETMCENSSPVTLSTGGLPAGGWFSSNGSGVSNGDFDPMAAGTGTHPIFYYFTSALGCNRTATDTIIVDACVGLEEANSLSGWKLFPNPTNGMLTLSAPQHQGTVAIEVYTATGKLVLSEKRSNFETSSIDLSALDNGAYFVRISNGVSGSNYRVVKTN
jgi:hypothetical protein